jgi:dGTPase
MLAECMRDHGGFDHNRQSLRVVELLETPYPNFPGLNLTFEVREGLRKHEHAFKTPDGETYNCTSLEAQVADLADEITYYTHDLDDAVDFEILSPAQLGQNEVWRKSHSAVLARYACGRELELHKLIIRDIIDHEVHDLVATSAKSIAESDVQSADDVRRQSAPLIRYSDELAEANRALRKFLYQNVYYHPRVSEVNRRACEMLRRVFEAYLVDPDRLGDGATRRIEKEGLHRTVCDYVAGMTDRYLMEEYARITGGGDLALSSSTK